MALYVNELLMIMVALSGLLALFRISPAHAFISNDFTGSATARPDAEKS